MPNVKFTEDGKMARSDDNPGALVSVDSAGLDAYRKKKRRAAEIDSLREEVREVKSMLTLLLEKLQK